jgi:hypothetical protein
MEVVKRLNGQKDSSCAGQGGPPGAAGVQRLIAVLKQQTLLRVHEQRLRKSDVEARSVKQEYALNECTVCHLSGRYDIFCL